MNNLLILFAFLDIAPPEPFKYGGAGRMAAIAFGLFLTAIATAVFLLFRKKLSSRMSAIISGILLLAGIGGGVVIWQAAAAHDADAERNRIRYEHVPNPYARRGNEIPESNGNSNTNQTKATKTQNVNAR
jgi:hypothetical protein